MLGNDGKTSFTGEIEVDESYFGDVRKGKRGRGAAGKVPVFGILKRDGRVYTQVIPDAAGRTLMPIIQGRVQPDSVVLLIVSVAIMCWTFQSSNTTGSTIENLCQSEKPHQQH